MQTIKLTKVELRRLLMSRKTYILMAINILIIGMGYIEYTREICSYLFLDSGASTVDNVIIPYAFGTLAGSLIWGISLLIDSDRIKKNPFIRSGNYFNSCDFTYCIYATLQ